MVVGITLVLHVVVAFRAKGLAGEVRFSSGRSNTSPRETGDEKQMNLRFNLNSSEIYYMQLCLSLSTYF